MINDQSSNRPIPRELLSSLLAPVVVVLAAAALLRVLDAVPTLLAGEPAAARACATVAEAERRLGARLALPAYFPETLAWPPAGIRVAGRPPRAAALAVAARSGTGVRLLVAQTLDGGPIPEELLAPGLVIASEPAPIEGAAGTLARLLDRDGREWKEVAWTRRGRRVVLRFAGSTDELLRMAGSVHP